MASIAKLLMLAAPLSSLPLHGRFLGVTVTPQPPTEAEVMESVPSEAIVPDRVELVQDTETPALMTMGPLRVAVKP